MQLPTESNDIISLAVRLELLTIFCFILFYVRKLEMQPHRNQATSRWFYLSIFYYAWLLVLMYALGSDFLLESVEDFVLDLRRKR